MNRSVAGAAKGDDIPLAVQATFLERYDVMPSIGLLPTAETVAARYQRVAVRLHSIEPVPCDLAPIATATVGGKKLQQR
jgi:hypothetical protein